MKEYITAKELKAFAETLLLKNEDARIYVHANGEIEDEEYLEDYGGTCTHTYYVDDDLHFIDEKDEVQSPHYHKEIDKWEMENAKTLEVSEDNLGNIYGLINLDMTAI